MTLELRRKMKKRKPHFRNHNSHKIKRTTTHYRRPRGLQNKMRLHHKSYARVISPGYRAPRAVRGMHHKGLYPVVVSHMKDLEGLDAKTQGVVLASRLGKRKRIMIAEAAKEANLTLLNLRDVESYKKDAAAAMKKRQAKSKARKAAQEAAAKKKEKKEKKEKQSEEEQDKEAQKKELDKVLTKKE